MSRGNLPVLQFVPTASGPVTGHHRKEPGSLFARSLQVFIHTNQMPPEQSQLSQPFLTGEMPQSLHHLCGPSLDSLQYVHVSPVLGSHSTPPMASPVLSQKRRITPIDLLVTLFLMQPRKPLAAFEAQAHCWLMFNLVSTRTPGPFLQSYFPAGWPPVCSHARGRLSHLWVIQPGDICNAT